MLNIQKSEKKEEYAIKVENVSKTFRIPHEKVDTLRGAFVSAFKKTDYEEFKALDGISFEVKKGDFFGVIGRNGSGKSTLLKILAGIYQADSGKIKIDGRISPFLELGIGFNPELSGRDNIYLNGSVLGLTKKQIDAKFDDIVKFSELERFIDQKLKNYSSGMQVRLAFSVAIHANRDILLMDEVLAVGDSNFQSKCLEEFNKYKNLGKTVILVTHDVATVQRYCDQALLLRNGKIEMLGQPEDVGNKYIYQNMSDEEKRLYDEEKRKLTLNKNNNDQEGKKEICQKGLKEEKIKKIAKITRLVFLNEDNKEKSVFRTGEKLIMEIYYKKYSEIKETNLGISVETDDGIYIFGYNTQMDGFIVNKKVNKASLIFDRIPLLKGHYKVNVVIFGKGAEERYDFKPKFKDFKIFSTGPYDKYKGFVNIKHNWF